MFQIDDDQSYVSLNNGVNLDDEETLLFNKQKKINDNLSEAQDKDYKAS